MRFEYNADISSMKRTITLVVANVYKAVTFKTLKVFNQFQSHSYRFEEIRLLLPIL